MSWGSHPDHAHAGVHPHSHLKRESRSPLVPRSSIRGTVCEPLPRRFVGAHSRDHTAKLSARSFRCWLKARITPPEMAKTGRRNACPVAHEGVFDPSCPASARRGIYPSCPGSARGGILPICHQWCDSTAGRLLSLTQWRDFAPPCRSCGLIGMIDAVGVGILLANGKSHMCRPTLTAGQHVPKPVSFTSHKNRVANGASGVIMHTTFTFALYSQRSNVRIDTEFTARCCCPRLQLLDRVQQFS